MAATSTTGGVEAQRHERDHSTNTNKDEIKFGTQVLLDSLTTQPDSLDKARELMKIAKDYEIAYKKRLREESNAERSAVRQAA